MRSQKYVPRDQSSGTLTDASIGYKALASEKWFGYGRWSAPYWFVGMEPGGDEDPYVYQAWYEAGEPELLDLYAHSKACNDMRWLVEYPPLQRTWMQLIRIVLGYEGEPAETEHVRRYQRDRLGRCDGDSLLIELSSVNARNLSVSVPERDHHRAERIAEIRWQMEKNKPKFAVFYGIGYRDEYEKVAGGLFDDTGFRWNGTTLCALLRHPAARPSMAAEWWAEKGREMSGLRAALGEPR